MKVISQASRRVLRLNKMEITASKERPVMQASNKNLNQLSQRCYGSVIRWTKTLDGGSYHRRKHGHTYLTGQRRSRSPKAREKYEVRVMCGYLNTEGLGSHAATTPD